MTNIKKFRIVKFKSKPVLAAKIISKSFDNRIVLRKIDMNREYPNPNDVYIKWKISLILV